MDENLVSFVLGVTAALAALSFKRCPDIQGDAVKWFSGRSAAKSDDEYERWGRSLVVWISAIVYVLVQCRFTVYGTWIPRVETTDVFRGVLTALLLSFVVGVISACRKRRSILYHASQGMLKSPLTSTLFFTGFFWTSTLLRRVTLNEVLRANRLELPHDSDHRSSSVQRAVTALLLCALQATLLIYAKKKKQQQQEKEEKRDTSTHWFHSLLSDMAVMMLYLCQMEMSVDDILFYGLAYCIAYRVFSNEKRPDFASSLRTRTRFLVVNGCALLVHSLISVVMTFFDSFVFVVASKLLFESFAVNSPVHLLASFLGIALGARTYGILFGSN